MTGREQGFLLLTSQLGDPHRRPLTAAQLRLLAARARTMGAPTQERHLLSEDLTALGYRREEAARILGLLEDRELLELYVHKGKRSGCMPITRVSPCYPVRLRKKLGDDSPGCLWAMGDPSVLEEPAVSLVGSRDLARPNRAFAQALGTQAARQGYVLVSGNARGADRIAQDACLAAGGRVISVVADALCAQTLHDRVLYLSEDSFDAAFSSQRALSRNRVIHCLGQKVFVAQAAFERGGTWDGTQKNLRHGWSSVFCFEDNSPAAAELTQMGAQSVGIEALADLSRLPAPPKTLFG